jgi:hypothetical protein
MARIMEEDKALFRRKLCADLDKYIEVHYVEPEPIEACAREKKVFAFGMMGAAANAFKAPKKAAGGSGLRKSAAKESMPMYEEMECACAAPIEEDFEDAHLSKLDERMEHLSDTFSEYLLYLIREKNMENADVYKRAVVDKKIFSKIKNNADYHPQKITALCLCVGAKLNLDEAKDLLARAGYTFSPCDKTDIIFSYFIENEIYDMIELDIQLEEHGLPCIIE